MLSRTPANDCESCSLCMAAPGLCQMLPTTLEAGATLYAQGERPQMAYFVKEGFVSLSAAGPAGTELLSLRGPSSLICMEALHSEPSPCEVRALSLVRLCGIRGDQLSAWIGPDGSPARAIVDLLLTEAKRQQNDASLRGGDCLARIGRFVLEHAEFFDRGPNPIRKQLLARLLHMRPETLSRCLTRLEREGVIDASRGVKVLDARRLAAIAIEDSDS